MLKGNSQCLSRFRKEVHNERPITVGRKNWLFYDTVAGANAAANLYSLIETCKANSVEPYGYLLALFKALPVAHSVDDYEALLPWRLTTPTA